MTVDTATRTIDRGIFASRKSPASVKCQLSKVNRSPKGFGLIEIVVSSAILSVSLLAISGFFQSINRASTETKAAVQGDYLLEEGVEIIKLLRDDDYTDNILKISTSTTHYFLWNGTKWATTTTNTLIDGRYERKFTITDVKRDANSDIATSGTYDPDIKLATVYVAWNSSTGTTTRSIQTYITNIFNN